MPQLPEVLLWDIWKFGSKCASVFFRCPMKKKFHKVFPATEEAVQWALHIQSTFLVVFHWSTFWHLPHSILELHHAKITVSASQLNEHCLVNPVEQFQGNYNIIEHAVCQVPDMGPQFCPWWSQLKNWWWSALICLQIAWGLSCAHLWLFWTLNVLLPLKYSLSTEFCIKMSSLLACVCRSHLQLTFVEHTNLKGDLHSTSTGMDDYELIPDLLVGLVFKLSFPCKQDSIEGRYFPPLSFCFDLLGLPVF